MQHYFTSQTLNSSTKFRMDSDIAHHFLSVLRSVKGSQFEIVDANDHLYLAEVVDVNNEQAKIIKTIDRNVEMPVRTTIICGLPKKEKAEWIVQKATELGAYRIIFIPTDWSIAKWDKKVDKKIQRLQKISHSAAEQSHRNVIPQIEYINKLENLINYDFDVRLIAYEESAKHGEKSSLINLLDHSQKNDRIAMFFGPEGGISPDEVTKLNNMGYVSCGLGPRILRTETAPLYFLSVVSATWELKSAN